MTVAEQFFDSNVALYLFSGDAGKADTAENLLRQGGHVSVQVLNEFASVATRKLKMSHAEVREALTAIRSVCQISSLTEATHDLGMQVAERYCLSIYDSMIIASALMAGCKTLFSEDMQDGLLINRTLRIFDPFGKQK